MEKNKPKASGIIILTIACCLIMAFVETVIEPAYIVKSAIKVLVFLFLPILYARAARLDLLANFLTLNKQGMLKLLLLGAGIYAVIIGAYALTKNIFDYSALVAALAADQRVEADSFLGVALYISLGNSFLEEFLFRFLAFIKLLQCAPRKTAYIFSSVLFAVYHIAMLGASFPRPLLVLSLIGLAIGGGIFNYVDEKNNNIYNSWIIHMFADFAIMTVWRWHI